MLSGVGQAQGARPCSQSRVSRCASRPWEAGRPGASDAPASDCPHQPCEPGVGQAHHGDQGARDRRTGTVPVFLRGPRCGRVHQDHPGLPGSGAHRAERRARIPRHQAASTSGAPKVQRWRGLGRSTSRQVARLFEGWTGQPLGGHAITDRPDRRLGFCFDDGASACGGGAGMRWAASVCIVQSTCASCRGKPWSKPSTCGSDERTGFAVRPPCRSRCAWCERAIQRSRSWARLDVTGWVRMLGGVHVKAGRGGGRPAGLQSRSRCKLACWASLFSVGQAQRVMAAASTGSRVAGTKRRPGASFVGCASRRWASTCATGSVHVLCGVHVESGVTGEGPAGTSPVGDASPTLGKPLLGWASTARWMMGPPWEAGSLGRRAGRPAVP
jgi:hypothetical protein